MQNCWHKLYNQISLLRKIPLNLHPFSLIYRHLFNKYIHHLLRQLLQMRIAYNLFHILNIFPRLLLHPVMFRLCRLYLTRQFLHLPVQLIGPAAVSLSIYQAIRIVFVQGILFFLHLVVLFPVLPGFSGKSLQSLFLKLLQIPPLP